MNSQDQSVGFSRWGFRIAVFLAATAALWFIFFGPGVKEKEAGGPEPGAAKVAPDEKQAKPKPWVKTGGKGDTPSVVSGNPAPQTPVLDEWMEKNWNQPDDQLIDGLLGFAQDTTRKPDERLGATKHALNLLSEKDIGKLSPLIDNPTTPVSILGEILANLHNRGEFGSITAGLRLLRRAEPEVSLEAKKLLAFVLDMDEQNEAEAIRLQAETRLIELAEAPPAEPAQESPPATGPGNSPGTGAGP